MGVNSKPIKEKGQKTDEMQSVSKPIKEKANKTEKTEKAEKQDEPKNVEADAGSTPSSIGTKSGRTKSSEPGSAGGSTSTGGAISDYYENVEPVDLKKDVIPPLQGALEFSEPFEKIWEKPEANQFEVPQSIDGVRDLLK